VRRLLRLSTLLLLTPLLALWLAFAPTQVGGPAAYVIVNGNSMEPLYHRGDLVILLEQSDYQVGDIVTYRHPQIGPVIHRIIGRDGPRYVFKGDNNDFVDTAHPARDELLGSYWLSVPKVGLASLWLADPQHLPFVLGGLVLLLLGGGAGGAARRRRAPRRSGLMVPAQWTSALEEREPPAAEAPPAPEKPEAPARERSGTLAFRAAVVAAALAAVAISAGIVALSAAAKPETLTLNVPGAYTLAGSFAYSARVPRSAVYPSGRIATGDPIFVRIVPRIRFALDYRFTSRFPHGVRGTAAFDAVVGTPQGWQRTLRLAPSRPFAGDEGRIVADVDLRELRRVVDRFQALTGISQSTYTLTLAPKLRLEGGVAGTVLKTSFAPTATLTLDEFQLSVAEPQTLGDGPAPDPLSTSLSGSVDRTVPNEVGLGPTSVSVDSARRVGGLVALVAALAALLAGAAAFLTRRAEREDEHAQIERELGDWIVPIASGIVPTSPVLEVEDMDSLVQIAEHYERMILRERTETGFAYLVDEGGSVYRYEPRRRRGVALPGKPHAAQFTRKGESSLPESTDNVSDDHAAPAFGDARGTRST